MKLFLALAVAGWFVFHLWGNGILVWSEGSNEKGKVCTYLHSTGLWTTKRGLTGSCRKTNTLK